MSHKFICHPSERIKSFRPNTQPQLKLIREICKLQAQKGLIKIDENNELPFLNIPLTQLLKLAFMILLIRLFIMNLIGLDSTSINRYLKIAHWYELVSTGLNRL